MLGARLLGGQDLRRCPFGVSSALAIDQADLAARVGWPVSVMSWDTPSRLLLTWTRP